MSHSKRVLSWDSGEQTLMFDLYFLHDLVRIRDEARADFPDLADTEFVVISDPFARDDQGVVDIMELDGLCRTYTADVAMLKVVK